MVFGNENGAMSVVIFCVLLSIRFIDLGYQISHSLINLAISFAILLISPLLMQAVPPVIGFIINFVSIMLITFMVCDQPEMGNGGLFLFGYVFLSGNPVTGASFINRALLTFTGYAICGAILFMKHRHKNKGLSFRKIVSRFDIHAPKSQWQIQLALGMSLLFLLGRIFNIDRFMWMGFACASMLSAWPMDMKWRPLDRAAGVIIGSPSFLDHLHHHTCKHAVSLRTSLRTLPGLLCNLPRQNRFQLFRCPFGSHFDLRFRRCCRTAYL